MAHLHQSMASLRISGDDLVPDEISRLLGCEPTTSYRKGQIFRSSTTGQEYAPKKTGMWQLEAVSCEPENLDKQVAELLARLSPDLTVWASLFKRFEMDLFCGLFMKQSNEGLEISAATLMALGERGIALGLDIYGATQELRENDLCPCESGKMYAECCAQTTTHHPNL